MPNNPEWEVGHVAGFEMSVAPGRECTGGAAGTAVCGQAAGQADLRWG